MVLDLVDGRGHRRDLGDTLEAGLAEVANPDRPGLLCCQHLLERLPLRMRKLMGELAVLVVLAVLAVLVVLVVMVVCGGVWWCWW